MASNLEFVCYNDGCYLRKYATNPCRKFLTQSSQKPSEIEIVVDKMHMAGHVDEWCKHNWDPTKFPYLKNVNCTICLTQTKLYTQHRYSDL